MMNADEFRVVGRYQSLTNWPNEAFDRITRLTTDLLDVPFAFISLVYTDDVWFRDIAKRSSAAVIDKKQFPAIISASKLVIVADVEQDSRFSIDRLVINNIKARFYAGAPLVMPDGQTFGVLGVFDTRVRSDWSEMQSTTLTDLAGITVDEMEFRRMIAKREQMKRIHVTQSQAPIAEPRLGRFANFFRILVGHSAR
jgi:GAF domain-containing protein